MRSDFKILLLACITAFISAAPKSKPQRKPDSCGRLLPEQLYNLKKTVEPNEFPWMASIRYSEDTPRTDICLATLISRQYLVTAAQCLHNAKPEAVIFGHAALAHNLTIDAIIIHPAYQPGAMANDIALIRLQEPIAMSQDIEPICLPSAADSKRDFVAQHLLVTGATKHSSTSSKLYIHIVDVGICKAVYGNTELFLCANSCDNGSKFIAGSAMMDVKVKRATADHYNLLGLLTSGQTACVDAKPDLFLRIDAFLEWIKFNIESKSED